LTRKLRLLDLGLVLLLALLGWHLRGEWVWAHAREQAFRHQRMDQKPAPPSDPLPKVAPLSAMAYAEVAILNLFSRDRNPQVILDPPAPPVEKPVPPFPLARGVMLWNGAPPTVVLTERPGGDQKGYHPGDTIGPWKILSVDNKYVVLEWDGKQFKKRIDELMDRTNLMAEAPVQAAPNQNAPPAGSTNLSTQTQNSNVKPGPGMDTGGGFKACVAGDTSPSGTVIDGLRKVVGASPMGATCRWEQAK
jgi:hypothetical protein